MTMTFELNAVNLDGAYEMTRTIVVSTYSQAAVAAQDWANEIGMTVDICTEHACVGTVDAADETIVTHNRLPR